MRRVIEALELRAVRSAKVELDVLVADAKNSLQIYIEDIANIGELNQAYRRLEEILGVLQVMQMHGAVLLVRELNEVIKSLLDGNAERVDEAQEVVSRGILRLAEYIDHVQAGKKDIPIVLLPLLNDLRASRNAPFLSENVLFFPAIDTAELPFLKPEKIADLDQWLRMVRGKYQKALLHCVQGNHIPDAAAQICKLFIHLHKVSVIDDAQRFWWVASAVAQAVAINGIVFGAGIASLFSALDRQIKIIIELSEEKFVKNLPEALLKNMLYYVAIADERGRIVQQVKKAFALEEQIPSDLKRAEIEDQISSPNDEVMLAVSKAMLDDLALIRDYVELYVHSGYESQEHIENLYSKLRKVGDTLAMVGIDEYRDKVMHELAEVEQIKSGEAGDVELSLLSVSETILEVETCVNNFISYRNSQHYQPENQFAKINNEDIASGTVDSEFQMAFQRFLSELIMMTERLKEDLVARMKNLPVEDGDISAPELSKRLLSVVQVAQLDELVPLAQGIHAYVSSDQIDSDLAAHSPVLDRLADCVVAFQCYIEQIEADMPLAEEILQHCDDSLEAIISAAVPVVIEAPEAVDDVALEEVDSQLDPGQIDAEHEDMVSVENMSAEIVLDQSDALPLDESIDEGLVSDLPELAFEKNLNPESVFVNEDESESAIEPGAVNAVISNATNEQGLLKNAGSDESESVGKSVIVKSEADPEILDIFIEEAEGVLEDMKQYPLAAGRVSPELGDIRRGFHTLKGSGRLAGAERLGEYSWVMESLLNKVLTASPSLPQALIDYLEVAIACASILLEQVKTRKESDDNSLALIAVANEMIEQGNFEPDMKLQAAVSASTTDPELTAIFTEEATQHLKVLREAFEDSSVHIQSKADLDRALHTLKGSARTAGAQGVAEVCALLESVLKSHSDKEEFDTETSKLLSEAVDVMENRVAFFEQGNGELPVDEALLTRLQAFQSTAANDDTRPIEEGMLPDLIDDDFNDQLEDSFVAPAAMETNQADEPHSELAVSMQPEDSSEEISAQENADQVAATQQTLMIDFVKDRDRDLCEIFYEEADDILAGCETCLHAWRGNESDHDSISGLRRLLHTLKGSSRMADINTIGNLSHAMESLVDAVADQKVQATDVLFDLMQSTLDTFHVLLDAARAGRDVELSVEFLEKVRSGAKGEALDVDVSMDSVQADSGNMLLQEAEPPVFKAADSSMPAPETTPVTALTEEVEVSSKEEPEAAPSTPKVSTGKFVKPQSPSEIVRVAGESLNEFVNSAGEVSILHSRLQELMGAYNFNLIELDQTVLRLRDQLRKLDMETEKQIHFKHASEADQDTSFDPLEMDRYSEMHQLSRSLGESVEDLRNIKDMLEESVRGSEELLAQQDKITSHLQHGLLRTRMVPFNDLESRLKRIVRQTATQLDKKVELEIRGGNSELDRGILDKIVAPLEHLLRNSISHGIEEKSVRSASGKSPAGNIQIAVHREGSEIVIRLKDDGAGIDVEKIRKKALTAGLVTADQALSDEEACYLVLHPGLSTAEKISQISGRGVGMDVVDKEIRELGGSLRIASTYGEGSEFTMRLPFTLAVTQALLVKAGEETYALTLSGINGVIRINGSELQSLYASEKPVYSYADQDYTFIHMGSLLDVGGPVIDELDAMYPIILLSNNEKRLALHVEASIGNREIVIKSLSSPLMKGKGITGATILGDGNVALIIDVPWIIRKAFSGKILPSVPSTSAISTRKQPLVMVVDDSITIRKVTTKFLEKNHYTVETAKDGIDALQKLQKVTPDLILLDIEMPRMDGYELASHIRNDEALQNIPIIMITSRSGDKHRQKALEIGVQKYLGKPYNEAQLLEQIEEFLN